MPVSFPSRIVVLSAESADWLYRLGAWSRVVGVTGYYRQPAGAERKPKISGFDQADVKRIVALKPDLVLAYCDVQTDITAHLLMAGLTVLHTNQRTLAETAEALLLIGRAVGREARAEVLLRQWKRELRPVRVKGRRPKVYFEEWYEPMICGISWVSELIEAAGGEDLFAEKRSCRASRERQITAAEVIARQPDVILASWCGKKANLKAIRERVGWSGLPAVREGRVYEIDSHDVLAPGFGLVAGFKKMRALINVP